MSLQNKQPESKQLLAKYWATGKKFHAKTSSFIKKYNNKISIDKEYSLNDKEKEVLKIIYDLPAVIKNSYKELSPALIANYLYDLVKSYNSLYQNFNILNSKSR